LTQEFAPLWIDRKIGQSSHDQTTQTVQIQLKHFLWLSIHWWGTILHLSQYFAAMAIWPKSSLLILKILISWFSLGIQPQKKNVHRRRLAQVTE
jgi:hypothetical protein